MRYAVTGSNGLIGKALTLKLANEGHSVIAIVRSDVPVEFMKHERIELAKGDIQDLDFLRRALKNVDGVFHVAAFAKPWAKDKSYYYKINEQGTGNVCEACVENNVSRFVYTASAGIHGPQNGSSFIDENTWPTEYHTEYEQSKFNGMQVALSYEQSGLEVNVVSPARVYAPGEVTESNVPMRMVDIYLNKGFGVVPTDGLGIGSYVFIDDVVQGHMVAMHCETHGEEFLIGGENLNYYEFFNIITEITGQKNTIIKVP
jgi:nucleoside-diphosphate-sugar epimerase